MSSRALLLCALLLAACGADHAAKSGGGSTTTATPAVRIVFHDLPEGYAARREADAASIVAISAESPDPPVAQRVVRRMSVPEQGLTVSVYDGGADMVEQWRHGGAQPSTLRGGDAITVGRDGQIVMVMWVDGDDGVIVNTTDMPADELAAIIDGVRITRS